MIEPNPLWYEILPPLPAQDKAPPAPTQQRISDSQTKAEALHKKELEQHAARNDSSSLTASSSDAAFLQRVLTSGTLSDRLSALTLLAQASPVHNTKALESLRAMAQKKGKDESLKALRAIVDWWVGGGAPTRKLRYVAEAVALRTC